MGEQKARMDVEGMTCGHCEVSVGRALEGAGADNVGADFRRGEAVFDLPAGADPESLRGAVREAGYRPGALERVEGNTDGFRPDGGGETEYDLAVIGSGGGAFAAAIRAVESGARVIMIERGTIGGTCVNVGCVPSKTLLRAAETRHHAGDHPFEGVETEASAVDYGRLVAQKDGLVGDLQKAKYADLIGEYGWEFVEGEASFEDGETLRVGEMTLRAGAYLVATGARPAVPEVPGLEEAGYLTSTTNMEQDRLPASVLVIGAGYVGLEQGQLLSRLGSRVTVMQRGPRLLPDGEPEVSEAMREGLEREGIAVLTGVRVERAEKTEDGKKRLYLTVDGEERVLEGEEILVAAGRKPNVEELGLDRAGVELDERGAVRVDEGLGTTNPRVWAVGDVTLGPQYVYVAAHEGAMAADNALSGAGRTLDFGALPGVMFTDPQVATVGLTEARARAEGRDVETSVLPLSAVPRALVNRDTLGVVKLVADADTRRLLGAHIAAENAGEVIYAATLAVRFGLTVSDLADGFAPYLTMSEGLKLAAQTFGRDVSKLSCCAA
ncbi:MAG: mercury(II) reductase [Actinomycetota bacterium]|jgi:mercuric reductase|nr:mercury(II) reductase [Actinomycetota bacterium]